MKNLPLNISMLFFLCVFLAISCSEAVPNKEATVTTKAPDLNSVTTELPKIEGYKTFYSNCVVCHSDRYIVDQPNFPEKTWTTLVTKMQKTFGAPVTDSSAKVIIQYLVAIKGTGT